MSMIFLRFQKSNRNKLNNHCLKFKFISLQFKLFAKVNFLLIVELVVMQPRIASFEPIGYYVNYYDLISEDVSTPMFQFATPVLA